MQRLFKQFSFPGGIPSHVAPETPGSIHEGGELGYALSHAYGAAFDNPDLLVACVVGDGEAETGPLATSWHSNKFLNPATRRRGAADPAPQRLQDRQPDRAGPHPPRGARAALRAATATRRTSSRATTRRRCTRRWRRRSTQCIDEIRAIQAEARDGAASRERPALADDRAPHARRAGPARRRWTASKIEGSWRSHQVPMAEMHEKPGAPEAARRLDAELPARGAVRRRTAGCMPELAELAPEGDRRMGANPHANGGLLLQRPAPARLPRLRGEGRRRRAQSTPKRRASWASSSAT